MANQHDVIGRALNALDHNEARSFDLAANDHERAELAAFRETLAELAAETETPPPASLRASLLEQIQDLPQETPAREPVSIAPAAAHETVPADAEQAPAGPKERAARQRWSTRATMWVASAAAAAVILVGGVSVALNQQPTDPAVAIAQAEDVQSLTLDVTGGGTATVQWSESLGESAIQFASLPELDGQVYEAWYIRGDAATPAGIFTAENGETVHVLDGVMQPGDVIGVTIEPEGGSETPTSDPILVAETTA